MNTTNNGERLNAAAEAGDIDLLYTVIQDDPYILEHIDSIPFVETPLHIAASMGHIDFAIEIMNLKPSFALKLNPQGFSPIHLAMQKNKKRMVYHFVSINKDLVRVRGREGITPLHFACQNGEVQMLAYFLRLCPESIEYLTVRRETALHISVKNEQYEALQVLVSWLKKNTQRGAQKLENKILNQRDKASNTILHISALSSDPQALLLLVSTGIDLKAKNSENKTALDIASTPEIKSILLSVGTKPSSEVTDYPTCDHRIRSKITTIGAVTIYINRIRGDISEEQRNTWLIVATLVATAIYQSGLSPPGGIYQVSAGDTNTNITSSNFTISAPGNAGKSVLSGYEFFLFLFINMYSFSVSILAIFIMLPYGKICFLVGSPMGWFTASYLFSMWRISPTHVNSVILFVLFGSILLPMVIDVIVGVYRRSRLKHRIAKIFNMIVKALFQ
ncbi:putative ankyrin repeat-containing domain, PGG domain-containing protein [Medicago truncatula]|uniref:Ankyrin repeat protein n=1 Tax=Medicago truncatula TaxID=3880 RepID=G7L7W8_MEDTR|nr:ankyrin repeat-containing protein BDA1 [Medicago truncatula]AET03520.1 ankyrin repeat protein [Medicago truncatula]RHN41800.1 putative ankyrin repeat-containing domain, PGG domain-containing protein [Medicago truncatula]